MTFNSKCPFCGCPAYVGLSQVECSSRSCKHFKHVQFISTPRMLYVSIEMGDNEYLMHIEKLLEGLDDSKPEPVKITDPRPMDQWD